MKSIHLVGCFLLVLLASVSHVCQGFSFQNWFVHPQQHHHYDHEAYRALGELFNVTNGRQWIQSSGWLKTDDYCSWFGVSCRIDPYYNNTQFISVVLPENNLHGRMLDKTDIICFLLFFVSCGVIYHLKTPLIHDV